MPVSVSTSKITFPENHPIDDVDVIEEGLPTVAELLKEMEPAEISRYAFGVQEGILVARVRSVLEVMLALEPDERSRELPPLVPYAALNRLETIKQCDCRQSSQERRFASLSDVEGRAWPETLGRLVMIPSGFPDRCRAEALGQIFRIMSQDCFDVT